MRGLLGLAAVAATLSLVQLWAHTPLLTLLGGVLFLTALWSFYLPVRYRLDERGVEVDYGLWRRYWPWERFQVYVPLAGAYLLSPFRRVHRLERYRAVLLVCPDNLAAVGRLLDSRLQRREEGRAS